MNSNRAVITDQIVDEVRARSRLVSSRRELSKAIFESLRDANVDGRSVALEDVKSLLVDAVRALQQGEALEVEQMVS